MSGWYSGRLARRSTEGLKVAAYAATKGICVAPHHDPQIHAHLVAGIGDSPASELLQMGVLGLGRGGLSPAPKSHRFG